MAPSARETSRLFHAIVIMGAALGTGACGDEAPPPADARVADAATAVDAGPTDGAPSDVPVDTILIL